MKFKEFGNKNRKTIILIHGGGLSWWNYKEIIGYFKKDYHIVVPILDGHGECFKTPFISIEEESNKIIAYIKENLNGSIFLIGGLSIGAQITTHILSKEKDIAKYALIESALLIPSSLISILASPIYNVFYGLIKHRWFALLQAKSLNIPHPLFDLYYNDSSKMKKQSLINITKCNESYKLSNSIKSTNAKVLILVGEKELPVMKKSASLLNVTIENSYLEILSNMRHGELSLCHPNQYISLIKNLINS